jgi:8-oxo-dGTP diphosphatase
VEYYTGALPREPCQGKMRTMPEAHDAPHPMSAPIIVVAAVVRRDGRFLVGRRPLHKRHGGLWEFPGGKLHPGESIADGVRRELAEELGLEVRKVGRVLYDAGDPGTPFLIRFVEVEVEDHSPTPTEHEAIRWLTPERIASLPLAPSDARFVEERLMMR